MLILALAASTIGPSLNLSCHGRSLVGVPVESTVVTARDSYGGSAYGIGSRSAVVEAEATIGFRMEQGKAKIRIPAMFLPAAYGGKAGWFDVKKLSVTEREITGKAAVNFLYNPSFRIDRMTGEMTSQAGRSFTCTPEQVTERKF